MFELLFKRPTALARHRDGAFAEPRRCYLSHCAERGMTYRTLCGRANYLLAVTRLLRLDKRGNESISLAEVEAAAARWANRRPRPRGMMDKRLAQHHFLRVARAWLQFLGRLQLPATAPRSCAQRVAAFADFQRQEKGLSSYTIHGRGRVVQAFLDQLCGADRRMEEVVPVQVDDALREMIRASDLSRGSVQSYVCCLRAFFRYAETRGWCRKGLAAAFMAPRIYAQESIPAGPSWNDVRRLLATTEGDEPTQIRDRAILMLLAVYGFRNGEVTRLQLADLDWERELIFLRRTKSRQVQVYPLSCAVGDAILRYLKEVRPRSVHREVFLTRHAPIRPLRSLWDVVGPRLRALGISLPHDGPHALRHACATHLLEQGLSLKEIGDYLGHHCPDSTRIYAKVNLAGLRTVADFDMEGLL